MFFSEKLSKFKNLKHCFFSRKNGFSKGIYESLNCGMGSNDKKENVIKNLEFVSNKIGCKKEFLITLNQTHSNNVVYFEKESDVKNKMNADAIVCKIKNLAIGILTADCAPILFYDTQKKIIGCAHSGWKGALNGIIQNTVKKFNELGSNNNNLVAVIGPCIKKENYQVGQEFYNNFIIHDKKNKIFFKKTNNQKFTFDLRGFVNNQISESNVKNIENIEIDTFSQKEFFF